MAAIAPVAGLPAGGTTVTVTGTGFAGASAVNFATTAAASYSVLSASTLTATAPAGTGTADVIVVTPVGTSAIAQPADQFTYEAGPTVSAVSPVAGPLAGATAVTITGTGFNDATAVDFGTTAATIVSVGSAGTSLSVTAPAGTGTVDVTVTTPVGTSATSAADSFTYEAAPTVSAISPSAGLLSGGSAVTVTGTGFSAATGASFGSSPATAYTVASSTSLIATSPAEGAGTVDVTVSTPVGTSATAQPADQFTYEATPAVSAVSPVAGLPAGGSVVTVTGTGFTGASAVSFGGVPGTAVAVNPAGTAITVTAPAGTGTVDVTVTTPAGTSATTPADSFTYEAAPAVAAVSPVSGQPVGGAVVSVTGTGFSGASAVDFGATAATSFTVVSAGTVTATAPAGTGTVDVTVTTPVATSATSPADQFTYQAIPIIASVSPVAGTPEGDSSVTITGTNLSDATAVNFGANAGTVTANSASAITVTSPAGTAGTVDITVTTPVGISAITAADQFTYEDAPTVSAVSPVAGLPAGATTVTVTGTGLVGASAVDFGGVAGTNVTVNPAGTQLSVTSPAGSGSVDVTVTTPLGTSATSTADTYTYETAPVVSSLSPLAGPLDGGASVTITGTGFTGASAVSFGSTAATSYSVTSPTEISAVAPAEGAGSVDVRVTTPIGTSGTSAADQFTYEVAPAVSAVSPPAGWAAEPP